MSNRNQKMSTSYKKLISFTRNYIEEESFFGCILALDKNNNILYQSGKNVADFQVCHRSCAKPMQLSVLFDLGYDNFFNDEQIAIMAASHQGTNYHTELVKSVLETNDIDEKYLKCPIHLPYNQNVLIDFIKNKVEIKNIHNNCSGKHAFMLTVCKLKNWDMKTYCDYNHPLQKLIINNLTKLCGLKKTPTLTKDGCLAPVIISSIYELAFGFKNLFQDKKYSRIKEAYKKYPKAVGGDNNLDTVVMQNTKNLVAKNGAGGLICIYNDLNGEVLSIKMANGNSKKARSLVALKMIKNLNWISEKEYKNLKSHPIFNENVTTLNGEIVGETIYHFD